MSSQEADPPGGAREPILRTLAHDLGNLAYRLDFLTRNLSSQIPDLAHRQEAVALLEDTSARLREAIARLRGLST